MDTERKKVSGNKMTLMQAWMHKIVDKTSNTKCDTKQIIRQKRNISKLVEQRLQKMTARKEQLETIQDNISEESHVRANLEKIAKAGYMIKNEEDHW